MSKKIFRLINNSSAPPVLFSILAFIIFSYHSLYRHYTFNSHALDLGIFTQSTYLYSQGQLPFSTLKKMVILGDHFDLILLFLSPLYKLSPTAETLLILQALFVSLSCVPIYLIAKDKTRSLLIAFSITFAYITAPTIIRAIDFDFHPGTMSLLPLSLILYAWYFNRRKLYWMTLFFSLLFKEDVTFFIFGLGAYQLFQGQRKLGMLTCAFALLSFYLIKFQIMPFFWHGSDTGYISTSILPLTNPIDLILLILQRPRVLLDQIFNSPIKLKTIDWIYRQFAFLPILSSLSWLTILPYLYLRFTSNLTYLWGDRISQ